MAINSKPEPIPVVCALIEYEGRVLLAQRPHHKHLGGKWEFPGGKVEPDENPAQALIREIREELGCAIILGRELPRNEHTYDQTTIVMIPYLAQLEGNSAEIKPTEHIAVAWAKPEELLDYDLAAADLPVVTAFRQTHEPRS
jgi:8-oxo-dGTP diphosphatase|uniref:(deoxy)nucleoside triphosphate pyrophosphohydrolase n=1 Tax=Cephaloticoccus sp. TaxID=1985742 RepID=UPI00404B54D3